MNESEFPHFAERRLEFGATLIGSALVALASWRLTGSPDTAWVCLVAGAALGAWALAWGWRVAAITFSLCIVPPGVIGENSAEIAVAASLALYVVLVTAPAETSRLFPQEQLLAFLLVVESLAFVSGALLLGFPSVRTSVVLFSLYFVAALSLLEAYRRPSLVLSALRCLMWLIALLCFSYLISYAARFVGETVIQLEYRNLVVYPPATFTVSSGGLFTDVPRLLIISGEPGLGAIFILIAMWCAIRFERGRRRALLVGLLAAGVLFSQSIGLVFALMVFVLGAGLVEVTRRATLGVSVLLALGLIPVMKWLTDLLLAARWTNNPTSLLDRGFSAGSFRASATSEDISLMAAMAHHAWLAVPLFLVIGFLAVSTIRSALSLGLVLAVASIALYAQPLQWHPGVWLMIAAAVAAAGHPPSWLHGGAVNDSGVTGAPPAPRVRYS